MRRVLVVAGCGFLTAAATGCESTEQESAKIGREDAKIAQEEQKTASTTLKLGAVNHSVRVSDVTLLSSSGRTAVAVKLTDTSTRAQLDVPLLVSVTGAGRKVLYSNDIGGLEPSLQRIGALLPGHAEWWVDDQVLTAKTPTAASVEVGQGTGARSGSVPTLATTHVQLGRQAGTAVVNGEVVSHSSKTQNKVPVFAVAVRAGRVTAAGRAVIQTLPGGSTAPVSFQIFLIGNPAGAALELTVVPTAG